MFRGADGDDMRSFLQRGQARRSKEEQDVESSYKQYEESWQVGRFCLCVLFPPSGAHTGKCLDQNFRASASCHGFSTKLTYGKCNPALYRFLRHTAQ